MDLVLLRDDAEHPIPLQLRGIFGQIAQALVEGDYRLQGDGLTCVASLDEGEGAFIEATISAYGSPLAPLSPAVWARSCYTQKSDERWSAIVDLSTEDEDVSDLAIHADVVVDPELQIKVWSVHVP